MLPFAGDCLELFGKSVSEAKTILLPIDSGKIQSEQAQGSYTL